MNLHARFVTVSNFDDQYFQVSFDNEPPAADYNPDAPMRPYILLQRQFEDDIVDGTSNGVGAPSKVIVERRITRRAVHE